MQKEQDVKPTVQCQYHITAPSSVAVISNVTTNPCDNQPRSPLRDECEFPRLNRDMPPPPGSLYLGNHPTFIEQYPQIRPKQSKTESTAPNPEPPAASTTNRLANVSSTPLLPRRTGPVKDSVIVTHQGKHPPLLL